jgi:23S rRNA pseudouridine1911/1915/1917 synthase
VSSPRPNPTILHEDNHCLIVDKPAGWLSQGDSSGDPSLVDWARDDLKRRYHKPGNVYIGLVHRLDRPVSGVILLAKTSKAASRLSEAFREGTVEKIYRAIVEGDARRLAPEGVLADVLSKDERDNLVHVVDHDGAEARTHYRTLDARRDWSLMELRPLTGRGHQLRVQLAHQGFPIWGDSKYGARKRLIARDGHLRIALHASRLTFPHPTRAERLTIDAPEPSDWPLVATGPARPSG